MSLNGQARITYTEYLKKTMGRNVLQKEPTTGLLSRNKLTKKEDKKIEPVDYLMEQFEIVQKARVSLKNGRK